MAEIDKALPNVEQTIKIDPKEIEQEISEAQEQAQEQADPVDIVENEDGSIDINFDPRAAGPEQGMDHFENLAEFLPDEVIDPLGNELVSNYQDYKNSRKDWEKTYVQGLDLLGFKYDQRSEPFQGASGATHPVLAEAVTQFQALAYKELLPASGPVRTQVVGVQTPEKLNKQIV